MEFEIDFVLYYIFLALIWLTVVFCNWRLHVVSNERFSELNGKYQRIVEIMIQWQTAKPTQK
jgi:hypothetical protein